MKIKWFGQAGYLLDSGISSIAIDPYFSDAIAGSGFVRLYPPAVGKGGLNVGAVISTHNHGDHLDVETLRDYVSFERFYGPGLCVEALTEAGFPPEKLCRLDRGGNAEYEDFAIYAVYAEHTADSIGVVVRHGDITLYFTGDTLMHENLLDAAELKPDIIFVCINGKFGNMGWQEAVELAKSLRVKTAVPMHYDMFAINQENPSLFTGSFKDTGIRSFTLERDEWYEIENLL